MGLQNEIGQAYFHFSVFGFLGNLMQITIQLSTCKSFNSKLDDRKWACGSAETRFDNRHKSELKQLFRLIDLWDNQDFFARIKSWVLRNVKSFTIWQTPDFDWQFQWKTRCNTYDESSVWFLWGIFIKSTSLEWSIWWNSCSRIKINVFDNIFFSATLNWRIEKLMKKSSC